MKTRQSIDGWKPSLCLVVGSLMLCFPLASCLSFQDPCAQQVVVDLQQRNIQFKPTNPLGGVNSALFSPDLYPIGYLSYERRTSDGGKLIDTLVLHVTQSITQTQQVESHLKTYADDPYGLRGLDLAGPVRYYRCGEVIAIYQAMWDTDMDPAVDKALTEDCGPAFVRYPPQ